MSNHVRSFPVCPSEEVLAEIRRRFRVEGQHIKANYDYGTRRKVRKDDIVGTFERGGRCVVMVKRRRLVLSHIAFFLSRKHWPTKRVVYRDGNYRNHSPSNIAYEG